MSANARQAVMFAPWDRDPNGPRRRSPARSRRAQRGAIEPGRRATRRGAQPARDRIWPMTKLLREAIVLLGTLPDADQDRAAKALLAFAQERSDYALEA